MYSTIGIPYAVLQFEAHHRLREEILASINCMPVSPISSPDHKIYNTDWCKTDLFKNNEYTEILKLDLFKELSQVFLKFGFKKFTVHNIWFQQYIESCSHTWHNHADCHYTCIYYLEFPQSAPPTQFINPLTDQDIFQVEVKEGDILIIPSMIKHCSPPISTNIRKTIISFNVSVVLDNQ